MKSKRTSSRARFKLPVVEGDNFSAPASGRCLFCGKRRVGEPFEFVLLSGGAVAADARAGECAAFAALSGFLSVWWHGAHPVIGSTKDRKLEISMKNPEAKVEIASNVRLGQFDLTFCSTDCLRAFLNHVVDELERKKSAQVARGKRRPVV